MKQYPCPCCGNLTFPVSPQEAPAFICPVCWWENDVFLSSANEPSDENHQLTLIQAKRNYAACGICYPQLVVSWAEKTTLSWPELVQYLYRNAQYFEIHCWEDETEAISLALQYGSLKKSSWKGGLVITGPVTKQFQQLLCTLPKPMDTAVYDKKTPFFSIFFDNGFSSEHYGTEIHYMEEWNEC